MTNAQGRSRDEPPGRGTPWVVAQIPLLATVILVPVVRRLSGGAQHWPATIALPARVIGVCGLGLSAAVFWDATRVLGKGLVPHPKPPEGAVLRTSGVYAIVRHPIYLGIIVTTASWGLLWNSAAGTASSGPCAAFFWLKSRHEERFLIARFADYHEYRRRVPALVPWFKTT
jgi:protein-S-isoprenylcysteine O-methyltransferase Ste14